MQLLCIIIIITIIIMDRLIGLGVSVSYYWQWGCGLDSPNIHNFKWGLSLERGPLSLVIEK